jgi:hypothetical protein
LLTGSEPVNWYHYRNCLFIFPSTLIIHPELAPWLKASWSITLVWKEGILTLRSGNTPMFEADAFWGATGT